MAKKDPYKKIKTFEVSARSLFGRPSQMNKTIEKWTGKGWQLIEQRKVRGKDRYQLTFEYQMSDEEIAAHKRRQRNGRLGCLALVIIAVIIGSLNSAEQARRLAPTQTFVAAATGTQVAFANATARQQSIDETATATSWTATPTFTPTYTPTITFTPSITPTPTITNTPAPTVTPRPSTTTYYVTGSTANARECPRTNCARVTAFSYGDAIEVIGTVDGENTLGSNQWREVLYQGQLVYVHSSLTSRTKPAPLQPQSSGSGNTSGGTGGQPQPIQPPVSQPQQPTWSCSGNIYNCSDFAGRCTELYSYFAACPGDPSDLDRDQDGKPCEQQCGG